MAERQEHPEVAGQRVDSGSDAHAHSLVDERAAANIRAAREALGMSQGELARQMAALGWPYYPQTVHRVEAGQRKISIGEAKALAELLHTTLEHLTWTTRAVSAASLLNASLARVFQAYEQIGKWTSTLLWSRRQLQLTVDAAQRADYHGSSDVRQLIQGDATAALGLSPEAAVEEARGELTDTEESIREHNDWADMVSTVIRDYTEGASIRAIAKSLPISYQSVRDILTENGVEIRHGHADRERTWMEPRPVVAVIVTSAEGVLITQRKDGAPPWGFVSGEIEPGERAEDAAVREVKEETCLEVRIGELIGERDHPNTGRHMIYMAATPVGRSTSVAVGDEAELAEVRWASVAEADELLPGMYQPVRDYLVRVLR